MELYEALCIFQRKNMYECLYFSNIMKPFK